MKQLYIFNLGGPLARVNLGVLAESPVEAVELVRENLRRHAQPGTQVNLVQAQSVFADFDPEVVTLGVDNARRGGFTSVELESLLEGFFLSSLHFFPERIGEEHIVFVTDPPPQSP